MDGIKTYTCGCGSSYTEVIPATGAHIDDGGRATAPATCTVDGEETHTCTVCNNELEKLVVPALGHDFTGVWSTTSVPTCKDDGMEETACLRSCGEKKTRILAKTPDAHEINTWTENDQILDPGLGFVHVGICEQCGQSIPEAHTFDEVDGAWYPSPDNSDYHGLKCTAPGCGCISRLERHSFDADGRCSCGAVKMAIIVKNAKLFYQDANILSLRVDLEFQNCELSDFIITATSANPSMTLDAPDVLHFPPDPPQLMVGIQTPGSIPVNDICGITVTFTHKTTGEKVLDKTWPFAMPAFTTNNTDIPLT